MKRRGILFPQIFPGVSFLPLSLVCAVLRLPAGLQSPGELMQSPRLVLAFWGVGSAEVSGRTHLTEANASLKMSNCVQADNSEVFFLTTQLGFCASYDYCMYGYAYAISKAMRSPFTVKCCTVTLPVLTVSSSATADFLSLS